MNSAHRTTPRRGRHHRWFLVLLLALAASQPLPAQDRQADASPLLMLLDQFLAAADDPAMHERFWDDSLVYTSSSGARFGKADILAGMREETPAGEPEVRYRAEGAQVMGFGDTAVVTFRLVGESVATEVSAAEVNEYFNTGTFRRVDGQWRAVAWQATRIPDDG